MRLERLDIPNYRVLRDLRLDFGRSATQPFISESQRGYTLDFLAGVNGTGKTTVLFFLSKLFRWLATQDHFPEPFRLIYSLGKQNERRIEVTNLADEEAGEPRSTEALSYRIDDGSWQSGKLPEEHLPEAIVIYTTGSEAEWKIVLESSEGSDSTIDETLGLEISDSSTALPGHRPDMRQFDEEEEGGEPTPRILFIHANRLPLVALCGLLASHKLSLEKPDEEEPLASVLESIGLAKMKGFSLRVRTHEKLTSPRQMEIVEDLAGVADWVVQEGADRLLVFDLSAEATDVPILSLYGGQLIELFQRLYSLYDHRPFYDPPLQEVNIFLKRHPQTDGSDSDESVHDGSDESGSMLQLFDWLSDGERSFLARMALFALFQADDLLILLDEPEVHFNDVWKREIVNMLDGIMNGHASHALITTHSSIALSDVNRERILVMRRRGQYTEGDSAIQKPNIQTFGADPSDIMVHVLGTPSPTGSHSVGFIRRELARRERIGDIEALAETVAPGYWRYRIQLEAERKREMAQ